MISGTFFFPVRWPGMASPAGEVVVAALHGAGEGLQADVGGAAVAGYRNGLHVAVGDFAFAPQGLEARLDTGSHRSGVLEGDMDVGVQPGRLGVGRGNDLHAARGVGDDDVIAEALEKQPQREHFTAALAGPVAGAEIFLAVHQLRRKDLEILYRIHYSLTP
jgi:hypothetical protein